MSRTLDRGKYALGDRIYGGPERGLYAVQELARPERHWVTVGPAQRLPEAELRRRLTWNIPGIAPLTYIGPIEGEENGYDGLVEQLPDGDRTDEQPPKGGDAIEIAIAIGEVLRAVQSYGWVLAGLRPETVFVLREATHCRFSGMAPRCQLFWMTSREPREAAPPAFDRLYIAPELMGSQEPTAAADVFSLCATLAEWISGYPFEGEHFMARLMSLLQGRRSGWHGPPELAPLIDRALAVEPARRPSLDEVLAELESFKSR